MRSNAGARRPPPVIIPSCARRQRISTTSSATTLGIASTFTAEARSNLALLSRPLAVASPATCRQPRPSGCSCKPEFHLDRSGMFLTSSSSASTRSFQADMSRSSVATALLKIGQSSSDTSPGTKVVQTTALRPVQISRTTRRGGRERPTPPPLFAPPGGDRCGPRSRRGNGGSAPAPATPPRRRSAQMVWPSTLVVTS